LLVLFSFLNLNAQTYNYSYTDPCTGNVKNIIIPINGSVTVGYYGFVENFTQQEFTDGTFETWTNQVFSQYEGSPCSEIVGLGGQINMAQDVALNTIGIINSLSSLMDLSNGATDFLSGSLAAASNSSNTQKGNKKNGNSSQNGSGNNNNGTTTNTNNSTTNNNQNQNNGTSNTTEGSQTTSGTNETSSNNGGNGTPNTNVGTQGTTSTGGSTTQSGSNENGNSQAVSPINNQNTNTNENNSNTTVGSNTGESSGNGTSGNGEGNTQSNQEVTNNGSTTNPNGNGSNNGGNSGVGNNSGNPPNGEETTTQTEEQGGGTNITQGATKTINQNREGGKPTVIASGDFVGFNFQNSEVRTGLKLTGGYHNMRWDGETARGGLVDYVSAQQGPNITGYHAWINKKSVGLLSGTLSVGFEGRGSVYGTLAGGQMFMFPKIPSLKAVYMGTVSYGQVYKTSFLGTALIGGGMYDLKFGKRIDVKLMALFVYSPYVSYYNDLVLKSPYVVLPSLGTNIAITKRFKFNINAGGAWAIKVNTLNYTITCGTRLLVGQ
jgi:hypothetical protein